MVVLGNVMLVACADYPNWEVHNFLIISKFIFSPAANDSNRTF
ncbi:hypothetical protein FHS68_002079 [Dyadobacter arcticus]|uniref:Uncharacterized protein n=1 Tax=Dyadobacter arcticus TaxID=1078754 RepID=A0ABX0UIU7_9BACT|nr:hypothetical protein [Dyadobacter arcticus]